MVLEKIRCGRVDVNGDGVVAAGAKTYYVEGLLPGETADIEVAGANGNVLKRYDSSSVRVRPRCPQYALCGGCTLQHLAYGEQLAVKTAYVRECLDAAGLVAETLIPCIGMKEPWNYRGKLQMAISEKGKRILAGFYEENTRKVVNADDCDIQDKTGNAIVHTCKQLFAKHRIEPYREDKGTGLVRHVLVRVAAGTGQILVVFVTVAEAFPGRNNLVTDLRAAHPEITSIVQNVNPRTTPIVLGERERIVYGKGFIEEELMGKRFRIGAKTFFQVNPRQTETLYKKAIEFAKPKATDIVVDAYSGVGTIAIVMAGLVSRVYGVEINAASVKAAKQNAWLNGVRNAEFHEGDAVAFVREIAASGTTPDIVVVDPPRQGLDPAFVTALNEVKPPKIVYISCDPSTLARDLKAFVGNGYLLKRIQPVDMFCQTAHVETVALLSKS
ncbi:MAG: 23S rRNA (uracil(1939)-C(5))-methyltransferase RlmD [Candidatus Izemoplasmatales bacterium]